LKENAVKNILVPTDFSESAAAALSKAAELARLSGGRITLLNVIYVEKILNELLGIDELEKLTRALDRPGGAAADASSSPIDALREAAQKQLQQAAARAAGVKIETAVAEGRPSVQIVTYANAHGIELIVMGTHGRSPIGKAFLGSVADHVIRQADCPVMVVRK
jgi:nucleotide-binding universal stress UspA family protein